MKKSNKSFILLIIIAVLIYGGFNSYYILESAEQAVIERFGEQVKIVNDAGINFKLPFVDKHYIVRTNEVRRMSYGFITESEATTKEAATYKNIPSESIALTKGSYLVNIGAIIQYRITNASDYIYNVDDPIKTLRLAFESVVRRNLQNKELNDALVNKDTIATEITPDLIKKLNDYEAGITIVDIKFTDVLVPKEVQFSYDDVNNAKNEKTEYLSKAQKYQNDKIPQARAKAFEIIAQAKGYKANTLGQAKGDIAKFNQVVKKYRNSKEITRTRMYLNTMQEILQKTPNKYIIDLSNDESGDTIKYLPLNPESINKGGK
ncbi:MAG: FtsH protease activity modulator HflK [Bacillota bacterium]